MLSSVEEVENEQDLTPGLRDTPHQYEIDGPKNADHQDDKQELITIMRKNIEEQAQMLVDKTELIIQLQTKLS